MSGWDIFGRYTGQLGEFQVPTFNEYLGMTDQGIFNAIEDIESKIDYAVSN